MINNVKDVIVPKKSAGKRHNYRFIDTIGSEAEKSQWIYSSSEVSLVIQVVDAAAYDMPCNGIETTNGFEHDLVFLQQICSSRWLSGTPVLVLLGNTGEMEKKLQGSNIQVYFPNFSGDRTTAGELRFHIRDLFLHVNRKYNNRLRVEFLQSGVTASIGKTAIGIIDKILTEQSILKYGFE